MGLSAAPTNGKFGLCLLTEARTMAPQDGMSEFVDSGGAMLGGPPSPPQRVGAGAGAGVEAGAFVDCSTLVSEFIMALKSGNLFTSKKVT